MKDITQKELKELSLALKLTGDIERDVEIPKTHSKIVNGWNFNVYSGDVLKSCSSSVSHNHGYWDRTAIQKPIRQFSSKLLATKALRRAMEIRYAENLLALDQEILKLENQ